MPFNSIQTGIRVFVGFQGLAATAGLVWAGVSARPLQHAMFLTAGLFCVPLATAIPLAIRGLPENNGYYGLHMGRLTDSPERWYWANQFFAILALGAADIWVFATLGWVTTANIKSIPAEYFYASALVIAVVAGAVSVLATFMRFGKAIYRGKQPWQ